MHVETETYVRLTGDVLFKLEVIASTIDEEVSQKQLVEGGIDHLFSNALRFLYRKQELSDDGLEAGLQYLDQYLADKTRKEIQEEVKK